MFAGLLLNTAAVVVSIVVGVVSIIVSFVRWVFVPLKDRMAETLAMPVAGLEEKMGDFDTKLDEHMVEEMEMRAEERAAVERIEVLLAETREEVRLSRDEGHEAERRNALAHIQIIKSTERESPIPTTVVEFVNSEQTFHFLWGNDAYLDMIGMTQDEVQADLAWETVHPDDRDLLRTSVEDVASRKDVIVASWRLVDAHTKTLRGEVHSVSEFLPGDGDTRWYYVAQYTFHEA